MNYKVSVVVPIYNGEKYLKRCIDSISEQTISEQIEVVLVDDGSIDGTHDICLDY